MKEENLANTLDRILAERLREVPGEYPRSPREAVHWAIRCIRKRLGAKPDAAANSAGQAEAIARIRSLPANLREPLRRYFVFQEAEEGICFSIGTTTSEFRRFVREAADYILMRQERMPELELKQPPGKTPRDR